MLARPLGGTAKAFHAIAERVAHSIGARRVEEVGAR